MAKVFDLMSEIHESPNRNTFDLTHKRHMTGKAGVIYPFLVQPVVPTDSFEIETGIGINLMPMWYPTQSNMRFIVHYFYVPYRLLMKDWKNTLQGLEEHDFPYLDVPASWYKTGSLADHLGIPTNLVLPDETDFNIPYGEPSIPSADEKFIYKTIATPSSYGTEVGTTLMSRTTVPTNHPVSDFIELLETATTDIVTDAKDARVLIGADPLVHFSIKEEYQYLKLPIGYRTDSYYQSLYLAYCDEDIESPDLDDLKFTSFLIKDNKTISAAQPDGSYFYLSRENCISINSHISAHKKVFLVFVVRSGANTRQAYFPKENFTFVAPKGEVLEISEHPNYCPYYNNDAADNTNKVKVLAFAARAYEMCYNSYYRNWHGNQPFVINGDTQYNNYLITDGSGADANLYALHERNWELDAYTSCLPSPQQGDAPVISVNSVGTMRIQDPDGTTSTIELRDLDGQAGLEVRSADIANPQHAILATRLTTTGMTIADFRQGNALTRFLEQSLRSGYRYADFIFGHFGKSPSHQELDMPLFLGGFTQNVDVNKISNVAASPDAPLGAFAGTGAGFGVSNHGITHYFDDFGLVLGVMMLVPDPAYSQVLPKHFTYQDRFDFYFPEFAQLGLQGITYQELCPIQSYFEYINGDSGKLLTDVFGYQRPNHEYIWEPDTLHGLFRTSLNGSVVNRRFGSRPELGDDFLRIKPEEVNDIFSVVEANEDIFIGQIVCKITATRPIPRVVVPTLGR